MQLNIAIQSKIAALNNPTTTLKDF